MPREYPRSLPSVYAREKRAETLQRWTGELGRWVREYTPRALPGCPPSAIMGFASNGTGDELTTAQERGYFGTEGESAWRRLGDSALVQELLGGPAPDEWRASRGGTQAQVAIGLANLLEDGGAQQQAWGTSEPAGSLWGVAASCVGWSSGPGAGASTLHPWQSAYPNWGALARAVAESLVSGAVEPGPAFSHGQNPAYVLTRARQKLATGALLEVDIGAGRASWYNDGLGSSTAAVEDVLARAGSGASLSGLTLPKNSSVFLSAVVALTLGAAAVYGFRAYRKR